MNYTSDQKEEIKEAFKKMDITAGYTLDHEREMMPEEAELQIRTKKLFSQYWYKNLHKFGINRDIKNYSGNYPINLLMNTDSEFIADNISELIQNTEIDKTIDMSDFDLQNIFTIENDNSDDLINELFALYNIVFQKGLKGHAKKLGKSATELTNEEIIYVLDKVMDILNEEQIEALMIGQQVPELYQLMHNSPAYEDFVAGFHYDKDNFEKKWTHAKTRIGAMLSLDALAEDESFDVPDKNNISESFENSDEAYEELKNAFLDELNDTERQIFLMREKGMTLEEIADALSYRSHSTVSKRLKKMRQKYERLLKNK